MTDGIRRTSLPVNTQINEVNQEASTEANKPALQNSKIQDSFEKANPVLYQNTKSSPADIPTKIDPNAANLLDQQLLSARLGKRTSTNDTSSNSSELKSKIKDMKSQVEDLKQLADKIQEVSEEMPGLREAVTEYFGREPRSRSSNTEISTRTKTSELFESQNFKPITDNAVPIPQKDPGKISERSEILPKYILHQEEELRNDRIKECDKQIQQCKEDIKNLESQIKELDEDLAKAQQEYAQNPTPELAKKIAAMKQEKDELRNDIKQKNEETKDLQNEKVKLATGKDPEENAAQPREATN